MRSLQLEDGILAAWNVAAVPLLVTGSGGALFALGAESNAGAGVIQLLAVAGVIVAIATRPAGVPVVRTPDGGLQPFAVVFIGPLVSGVAFVAGSAATHLGIAVDGIAIGSAFMAIVAAMVFRDRLPVVDARLRRMLVTPFILVAAGMFDQFAADIIGSLDLAELTGASLSQDGGFVVFIGLLLLGGLAAIYAALVAAPRSLADPGLTGLWPLRFAIFVLSAVLGIGWLSVLSA